MDSGAVSDTRDTLPQLSQWAFWFAVACGILPLAIVSALPFGGFCRVAGGTVDSFCQIGIQRAQLLFTPMAMWVYIALFTAGLLGIAARFRKRPKASKLNGLILFLCLLPLLPLSVLSAKDMASLKPVYVPGGVASLADATRERIDQEICSALKFAQRNCPSAEEPLGDDPGIRNLKENNEALVKMSRSYSEEIRKEKAALKKINDIKRSYLALTAYSFSMGVLSSPQLKRDLDLCANASSTAKIRIKNVRRSCGGPAAALQAAREQQRLLESESQTALDLFNAALQEITRNDAFATHAAIWKTYNVVALMALVCVLWLSRLFGRPMRLLFGLMLVVSAYNLLGTAPAGNADPAQSMQEETSFALSTELPASSLSWAYPFLFLFLLAVLIRLVVRTVRDNGDVFHALIRNPGSILRPSIAWQCAPIVICVAFGWYLQSWMAHTLREVVYEIGAPDSDVEPSLQSRMPGGIVRDFPREPTTEGDIIRSVIMHTMTIASSIENGAINDEIKKAINDGKSLKSIVLNALFDLPTSRPLPPRLWHLESSLEPPSCRIFLPQVKRCFKRSLLKAMDSTYRDLRWGPRSELERVIDEKGGDNAQRKVTPEEAKEILLEHLSYSREYIITEISRVFYILALLQITALFVLCVALVRSIAHVLARNLSATGSGEFMSMEAKKNGISKLSQAPPNTHYTFPPDANQMFYCHRGYDVNNVVKTLSLPQPLAGVLTRIRYGIYTMSCVGGSQAENRSIRLTEGGTFVELKLTAGNRVYIAPERLVAFSDRVKLTVVPNLRLAATALGRIFFLVVELKKGHEEGILLLRCDGVPDDETSENVRSYHPNRLVAWTAECRIAARGGTSLKDIYFSGAQAAVAADNSVIVDVQRVERWPWTRGVIRFLPAYLLPF